MIRREQLPLVLASMCAIVTPAYASGFSFGEFQFIFDGVATLGLIFSGLAILLGYRLMVRGIGNRSNGQNSQISFSWKSFQLTLANAAPGVIFAVLGCVGLVASLSHVISK